MSDRTVERLKEAAEAAEQIHALRGYLANVEISPKGVSLTLNFTVGSRERPAKSFRIIPWVDLEDAEVNPLTLVLSEMCANADCSQPAAVERK